MGWQEGGRRDMMGVKDNEISYSYLSFWVSYSSSWASLFSFLVYWIKPEVGWITLWGEIFRRMSRILCYPATCSAAPNSCVCSKAQIFPKNKSWSHLPPYSLGVVGIGQSSAVALKTCDSCPRICQQPIVQPSQFGRDF